jgi:Zn ribbon nucleic-acid-binding protein
MGDVCPMCQSNDSMEYPEHVSVHACGHTICPKCIDTFVKLE